ncbi:MAG TPA: hypothetical protein PJ986_07530, partial [Gammaproteobacteria bacterium]|nr:hypothetical protein [Gammaproteobacteria bacterium]
MGRARFGSVPAGKRLNLRCHGEEVGWADEGSPTFGATTKMLSFLRQPDGHDTRVTRHHERGV